MSEAKIRLSQKEMELVSTTDWVLTKNAILQKINQLLAGIQAKQQLQVELHSAKLPPQIFMSSPKISKGEKYKGLPYLILDYPRLFEQQNIAAIRTMFWWGNFFSVTLHLSGIYKKEREKKLIASYGALKEKGFYTYCNNDPWEHHFEKSNYRLLTEVSTTEFEKLVRDKSFIKIANKISLQQLDDAEEILMLYYKQIIELLAD